MKIVRKWLSRKKAANCGDENNGEMSRSIVAVQRKAAAYLNRKAASWTTRQLKIRLVCFCLLAGGYSVFVMIHAVIRSTGPPVKKVRIKLLHDNEVPRKTNTSPFPDSSRKYNYQQSKK